MIMKFFTVLIFIAGLLLIPAMPLRAQTCCSGGVPLANNIGGMPKAEDGTFMFSVIFDANFLRTLKDGTEKLDDFSRQRTTYSALIKAQYAINDKLSVEGLFSGIRQERNIEQGTFSDFKKTTGLGDAVLLANFNYLSTSTANFTFAVGPKIPTGPSDLKDDRGITMNADMQPGSGAWDLILHHRIAKIFNFRPQAAFSYLVTYRLTGENPDYLGSQVYEFGNELQMLLGWSESQNLGKLLYAYGLSFRYRHAAMDKNNHVILPNTGGQWIFLMPSLSWHLNQDVSVTINAELPLFSEVEGTQLTPSARANIGMLWTFRKKPQLQDIFNSKLSVK